MLELVVATAMLATVMTAVISLIRTSHAAWEAHEQDYERMENAYATLRHIVRCARQAQAVTHITDPSNPSGQITLLMPSGELHTWQLKSNDSVYYGIGAPNHLLATDINELVFLGYRADGVTQATSVEEIQLVECRTKTILLHGAGESRIVRCKAWLRSW